MRRTSVVAAAMILGGVACLSGGDYPEGEGACPVETEGCPCSSGGGCDPGLDCRSELCVDLSGGAGAASCAGVCARFAGCFGPTYLGPDCDRLCEEEVQVGALTQACLTCLDQSTCSELRPEDGSVGACYGACTGDDPGQGCVTDEECASEAGEVCDFAERECQVACAADADCDQQLCCPDGDVPSCRDGCEGGSPCPEGEGLSSSDGLCHPTCAEFSDCYPLSAYCAADSLCYATEDLAQCARVGNFPRMVASAPLIFGPEQDTIGVGGALCTKAPATCTSNGNVCQFSFWFYDPEGDVARTHSALYSRIRLIDSNGGTIDPYDVLEAHGNTLSVQGCFDEADVSVMLAVVLLDEAGNQSNPLCFSGSAP